MSSAGAGHWAKAPPGDSSIFGVWEYRWKLLWPTFGFYALLPRIGIVDTMNRRGRRGPAWTWPGRSSGRLRGKRRHTSLHPGGSREHTAIARKDANADRVGQVDLKLEVITLPVSDVDRAKEFYEGLGWRLDADFSDGE